MDKNTNISSYKTNTHQGKEEEEEEEEYINMEVRRFSNSSILFSRSTKEFEFQSSSSSSDRDNQQTQPPYATSHADELFYMGRLLPLHFQMSRNILQKNPNNHDNTNTEEEEEERFHTPILFASTPIFNNTPFESCNVSPSESCHVSRELNPDEEYFRDHSSQFRESGNIPWKNEQKKTKNKSSSILGYNNKLKYWSYLKSLFTKSSAGCSDHRYFSASTKVADDVIRPSPSKLKEPSNINQYHYVSKKGAIKNSTPFGQIKCSKTNPSKDIIVEDPNKGKLGGHRRSFSGAFKKLSTKPNTCASSGDNLKRSISSYNASSEVENPIQAAIAHCKKSQKTMDGMDHYSSIATGSSLIK